MLELDKKYFHPDGNFNFNEDFRWLDENIYLKEFSLLLCDKFPFLIWKKDYFDANPSYRRLWANYSFNERMMRFGLILANTYTDYFCRIAVVVEDVHSKNLVAEELTYYIESTRISREMSSFPNETFPCNFLVSRNMPKLMSRLENVPFF